MHIILPSIVLTNKLLIFNLTNVFLYISNKFLIYFHKKKNTNEIFKEWQNICSFYIYPNIFFVKYLFKKIEFLLTLLKQRKFY